MEKWAEHRATDQACEDAAHWGSRMIFLFTLCDEPTKAKLLAVGAEKVLRSIISPSCETTFTTIWAAVALKKLMPKLPS